MCFTQGRHRPIVGPDYYPIKLGYSFIGGGGGGMLGAKMFKIWKDKFDYFSEQKQEEKQTTT